MDIDNLELTRVCAGKPPGVPEDGCAVQRKSLPGVKVHHPLDVGSEGKHSSCTRQAPWRPVHSRSFLCLGSRVSSGKRVILGFLGSMGTREVPGRTYSISG